MIPHEVLIDALAEARLEKFHIADRDRGRGSPSWARSALGHARTGNVLPPTVLTRPTMRIRIGHGLLVLGAAIAGEERPNRTQRAA